MKRQILITLLILLFGHSLAPAGDLYVPKKDLQTIQDGINAAVNGDVVIVMPGTYTGHDNVDLDFGGKAITLKSYINLDNPNWDTIADTIIDCGGNRYTPHRAFFFHSGETNNSKVIGFTIINGYQRPQPRGADGAWLPLPLPQPSITEFVDPCDQEKYGPYAKPAGHAAGNADGGAIFCNGSSPTIKYCVIQNCTITGGQGGDGARGRDGPFSYRDPEDVNNIIDVPNGQWGGRGGDGNGEGHGGAIACLSNSSPVISNCIIRNNTARGGSGGDGGEGGWAEDDDAGAGGNGGDGYGDGHGGGIYSDGSSTPTITDCQFINNIATTGLRSKGGKMGAEGAIPSLEIGDETVEFTDGDDGFVFSNGTIAGGAGYYLNNGYLDFNDCNFIDNKAYMAYQFYFPFFGEDIMAYTIGGGLYSGSGGDIHLNNCLFTGNLAGAVYCRPNCNLDFDGCTFNGNGDTTSGGAVYINTGCSTDLRNCSFTGNSAYTDGGAVESLSNLVLTNCSFGGNTALGHGGQYSGYGGAVEVFRSGSTLTVDANSCSFSSNQAVYGGAFFGQSDANFIDCYFIGNTAERGGGLYTEIGSLYITGGAINENNATDEGGGGLNCFVTDVDIRHCTIMNNSADDGQAYGGAIDFKGGADDCTHRIFNCLIAGNSAAVDGGAVYCLNADPQIGNCTFHNNDANGFGGAIFADYNSDPNITDSIFHDCNSHAIHEEDDGGNATAEFCLFYENGDGDYYDSSTEQTHTNLDPDYNIHNIPGGAYNIYGDPLFESGPLGGFYLNQNVPSPAVDTGSEWSSNLGLDTYTTDPNNMPDDSAWWVDKGYHYVISDSLVTFQLTVGVAGGDGTIEPTGALPIDYNSVSGVYTYYAGTIVTFTATPETGWRIKGWGQTDNDSSTETTNTAVMNYDRDVTVEFELPKTLRVKIGGGPGYYSGIQDALYNAVDGDTILVYQGTYYGPMIQISKSVEIKSEHPDDPTCVANTILDGTDYINPAFSFYPGTETLLNGLTIRNWRWGISDAVPSPPTGCPGLNGHDGTNAEGGAIYIGYQASPTIKNCIIRDNQLTGSGGGDGCPADADHNAGRGGWAGWIRGGAIYCGPESSPIFINCKIINNQLVGHDGGDGGNQPSVNDGEANYGGNWSRADWLHIDPTGGPESPDPGLTWIPGDLWAYWTAEPWIDGYGNLHVDESYFGDYRWYGAYGGGVFCDVNSTVTFIDCNIMGNRAVSGMSGSGGDRPGDEEPEPEIAYQLPSFGGGVYCAAGSVVTFDECTIRENVAVRPDEEFEDDPDYHLNPWLGHGGGVCAENSAVVTFINCDITENEAAVGGGVHLANANPVIRDCNFTSNRAYQGGAVYGEHGPASIIGCTITGNEAFGIVTDPNGDYGEPGSPPEPPYDPNRNYYLPGDGGGIHFDAMAAVIADCNISGNEAGSSGGGVYFGGENISSLNNCLLTDNIAGRDGGGVSTNIFAQLTVSNCTIVGNAVTAEGFGTGFGGGLSCSYETTTDIINSILWNNKCINGAQLAVGTGFEHDANPSTINVSFSDIGPRYDPCNPFDFNLAEVVVPSGDGEHGSGGNGSGSKLVDGDTIYGGFGVDQSRVKVIVSLFEPAELREQTDWSEPTSVAVLRAEIADRQDTVLSSLSPFQFSLRYQFENQAGFSGEVSVGGLDRLLADPLVQYIEPVRYVTRMLAQGIPLINADAYRQRYNGSGIAIAICDDGIDYRHQMLGGGGFPNNKVIGGYDFGDDDPDPMHSIATDPTTGHGTCCAGIAAGDPGTVGDYIGGVAYNAKIYALKIFNEVGIVPSAPTDAAVASWDWCISHQDDDPANPIKVISNSWADTLIPFNDANQADDYSPAMTDAANNAEDNGITILASSGNDGLIDGIYWPAAMSGVISVGAVHDINDTVMYYSNTAEILDILAPSEDAYTTDIIGPAGYDPCDYNPYFNGTSAACPYAAGAVAALQSAAFDMAGAYLTPDQVLYLLTATGVPITDSKVLITKPRIDLGTAILNLPGSPIYVEQGCTLNGWNFDPYTNTWNPDYANFGNISEEPDFIAGYLLRQVAAGQDANSPCVDAGSDTADAVGMDIYTTRTDSVFDSGIVDMGFHYRPFIVTQYWLTVTALEVDGLTPDINEPDPNVGFHDWYRRVPLKVSAAPNDFQVVWSGTDDDSVTGRYNMVTMNSDRYVFVAFGSNICDLTVEVVGNGSVSPMSGTYDRGTVVDLTATPDQGYRVGSWSGTDDDTSTATTNTVTMDGDRTVTVEFEQTQTLNVPSSKYPSIQQAFDAAGAGDTILVATGVWETSTGYFIHDKPVIITGTAPDDPCTVANTVIEMQSTVAGGWVSPAFIFYNVGTDAVLDGITIRGFNFNGIDGEDGEEAGESGENGSSVAGGAMYCIMASPTIKNCIIEDCNITGGDGGDGASGADPNFEGGHGGWPGYAFGGGLACLLESSPIVTNCTFRNCGATGGNGGDGGNGNPDPGGNGGRGGGWYYGSDSYWYGVPWPYAYHIDGRGYDGEYDFYTRYSGKGGAVYVGPDCAPVFNHCTFTNNSSYSGNCGICGQDNGDEGRDKPGRPWVIENSGGAVYCDTGSSPIFTDCVFNNNTADINDPADNDDPYVSLGGAVAFEDGSSPVFENCMFNGNLATIGGAVYSGTADPRISGSDFVFNVAYHGAGLYCIDSNVLIENCDIVDNTASVFAINAPNDMNNTEILGQGGGIYCSSSPARIIDCNISGNEADASGGGVYFAGVGTPLLGNCLITDNQAGRDGGGVSADWGCELTVSNCTIVDNTVTGSGFDASYGGGLYCCYDSNTTVINSILWGNSAETGMQLGVGTGFEFEHRPSILSVYYSDVQGMRLSTYVDQGCTLNWDFNIGVDPDFAVGPLGDYYLSQTDTGDASQTTDSPCVDAGSDYASYLGMMAYTTRTNQVPDRDIVDMGYHYPFTAIMRPCRFCDLIYDGIIDFRDFAVLATNWLAEDCSDANGWCNGADITFDTKVAFDDLDAFAQCWLVQDTNAPVPNPSRWRVEPYLSLATAPYSIAMTAETAVDGWGWDVEYYFDCNSGPCHDSGWQSDPNYEDTDLAAETEYGYSVKARDQLGWETELSVVVYTITSEEAADNTPPNPDPMTWALVPYAISANSIQMLASTASDVSGVQYYFDCVSGGCHDSGWQDDPNYEDIGLTPNTTYTYRVRARDMSLRHNTTDWSTDEDVNTLPAGTVQDIIPPAPAPIIIVEPNAPPVSGAYQIGLDWHHAIVATAVATDVSGVDYYLVVCLDDGTLSSGPLQPVGGLIIYEVDVDKYGGQYAPQHQWQVFVYDIYGNWASSQIVFIGGAPPL